MALTGIQIYKLLPQTNCKDCGFPTCLAFAMKLAAKQADLAACPYVSETSKAQLESASAPPIRLVTVAGDGTKMEAGNEVVMFRHEKTFFHRPGLFIRVKDTTAVDAIKAQVAEADAYVVDYVGIKLGVDGFAVEATSGEAAKFSAAVAAVRAASKKPLVLIGAPELLAEGVKAAPGAKPLLYAADADNWQKMAEVAKAAKAPVAVRAATLDALAQLTDSLKKAGVEDLVLDPQA
jgi:acetyl-CoA decarbonylase/synthase, CODH/ACS complex subunit gamma